SQCSPSPPGNICRLWSTKVRCQSPSPPARRLILGKIADLRRPKFPAASGLASARALISFPNRAIELRAGYERTEIMTIARKALPAGRLAGLALVLAGCRSGGGGGSGPIRPAPTGVEGTWIDAQGTGLSTISGGIFTTVATDTGQKLAEGSYALTTPT